MKVVLGGLSAYSYHDVMSFCLLALFNADFAAGHILAVEDIYRRFSFTLFGHFDKAKTLGIARLLVHDQGAGLHRAVSREHSAKLFFGGGTGEIAYQ